MLKVLPAARQIGLASHNLNPLREASLFHTVSVVSFLEGLNAQVAHLSTLVLNVDPQISFPNLHVSPLCIVPQKVAGDFRLLVFLMVLCSA